MRKIALLIAPLLLAGCLRVGPDFQMPGAPTEADWTEQDDSLIEDEETEISGWWTNFNDETLNDMIDYALQENYTLEAAANRILAARANLYFAVGEYFPQTQQAEGSMIRTQLSANAPNTLNAARDFWDNILGVRVAWELDFWGRYIRGIESAYGDYVATQDDYQDVQRLLISDIVLAYVQQKTVQNRIATLNSNIAIQYRSVEIAKVRWEGGYDSELDYAQAASLWKDTVAQKVSLEIDLKRLNTSLAILLGLTPEEFACQYTIDSSSVKTPTTASIVYPAEVLCLRPDLRHTIDLLYAQCAQVGIAVSDLYPRISLTGFIGLECASDTRSTLNQKGKHFSATTASPSSMVPTSPGRCSTMAVLKIR